MLYFIPTPIGNLSDISLRSLEILRTCEFIFCEDTRVCKSLITLLNSKFNANINIKTFKSLHSHNEEEVLSKIDTVLFEKDIAYLSDAGMPGISDPGNKLIKFAQINNIKYEVLPGANAALSALVSSGFCEKEFIFLGFLSSKENKRQKELQNILNYPFVSIVYEACKRILDLIEDIAKIEPQRELFAIKEISKKFENKFKEKAINLVQILKNENLNGEWVVIIDKKNGGEFNKNLLCENDILSLDIAIKTKAKLLSKLNGENSKKLYKMLLSQN
ncbi:MULTISPECIES: 16S rRNA (cytidine(1402)-2'-O)-methyltransferase [unclassified Campylobacter]|uniref:16S rRNA (cytidine(1402)-2'-O)-methyltransferase n=1 Tax=unclassified Campylobacter TaxID=2593542 RepID=UPI0012381092|nr:MULTISPECIES: 16S rRNA (cytidine(1402)-2'-O)-methyltransferase [unclassified Campylobacter]KAA6225219.1 16S rRNA (cytidine(1402)-2'-O)-methyltransferase [Campylobacter sp. LR196d]KAA6226230.1 16S rRNA (cytidine(1402)-2'-O)-methyltransferase [Campylobacter sp. LR185c]KAA6228969.1 16S rRNA (cytidine(1402)-2'-O)-methyltransferase [Campylobacter sp. LR286c]KAA6231432.1 16S rRNA (cytidine(1402)-2'-O)-methyltransferase [Campylobacter sp. LR264d]KAA6231644.1 16S rRNA (cytidine(1402)-2'-O)-methyltr